MSEVLEKLPILGTKAVEPKIYKVVLVKNSEEEGFVVANQIFDKLVKLFATTREACIERFDQATKNNESDAFRTYIQEIAEYKAEQANLILEEFVSHQGVLVFVAMPIA